MANRDGTGPRGEGPRTGRGMGKCPPDKKKTKTNVQRPINRGSGGRRRGR